MSSELLQRQLKLPAISPLAGKPATPELLVDLARLERDYYTNVPDMDDSAQRVSFGTNALSAGHRELQLAEGRA